MDVSLSTHPVLTAKKSEDSCLIKGKIQAPKIDDLRTISSYSA
jgi:hypothetical protein